MKAHTPFELPDLAYPVPMGMEKKLNSVLATCYKVEVEWLAENGTKHKVNGLDLDVPPKSGDELTSEELAQICLAMGHIHAETEEAEESRIYRIRQYYKDKDGTERKAFYKFTVHPAGEEPQRLPARGAPGRGPSNYNGNGWGPMDYEDPYSYASGQAQLMAERTQQQMVNANAMVMRQVDMTLNTILRANSQVLEEQRKMNEENRIALRESRTQTAEAQDRLFKMAIALTAHNEQQEAIQNRALEMFSMGYQWFWWSVQQQMAMSERRHRDELDRARQERKEENRWSFVKEIGPAILGFGGSILSAMGNNGLGSFLEGIAGEAAQAQQAAAGMGGFDPTGGAAPGGFSPGPGGPGPGPGGFSPGPSPSPSGAPAGFSPSPAGFGPAPGGGVPPGFQATPSAPPSPPPAPPSAANFDHLTPLQKAHRFGELFSGAAWETLRAGMLPGQIQALEQLITNQEPENVRPLMQLFTQALKAHLPGDEALSSVLTREQVQLASSIVQDIQTSSASPPSNPPMPGSTTSAPPSPQTPIVPAPPTPAGSGPSSAGLSSTGQGMAAPTGEAGGRQADPAEVRAFLAHFAKLPPATCDEIVDTWPTLDALRAAKDEDLKGLYGIGPVMLRKIREKLR